MSTALEVSLRSCIHRGLQRCKAHSRSAALIAEGLMLRHRNVPTSATKGGNRSLQHRGYQRAARATGSWLDGVMPHLPLGTVAQPYLPLGTVAQPSPGTLEYGQNTTQGARSEHVGLEQTLRFNGKAHALAGRSWSRVRSQHVTQPHHSGGQWMLRVLPPRCVCGLIGGRKGPIGAASAARHPS